MHWLQRAWVCVTVRGARQVVWAWAWCESGRECMMSERAGRARRGTSLVVSALDDILPSCTFYGEASKLEERGVRRQRRALVQMHAVSGTRDCILGTSASCIETPRLAETWSYELPCPQDMVLYSGQKDHGLHHGSFEIDLRRKNCA